MLCKKYKLVIIYIVLSIGMIWFVVCKWKRDEEWVVIYGLVGYYLNGFFLWLLLISNILWIDFFLIIYLIWN